MFKKCVEDVFYCQILIIFVYTNITITNTENTKDGT